MNGLKIKKNIIISIMLVATSFAFNIAQANNTTPQPQQLTVISASQNGYVFSSWKTGLTCTIIDNSRVIFLKADIGPILSKYDSGNSVVGNYKGSWSATTLPYAGLAPSPSISSMSYIAPTVNFTAIPSVISNGAYLFAITTSSGVHNIALFPNGFYVSKTNANLYTPGC
jgi:hypothetical protein